MSVLCCHLCHIRLTHNRWNSSRMTCTFILGLLTSNRIAVWVDEPVLFMTLSMWLSVVWPEFNQAENECYRRAHHPTGSLLQVRGKLLQCGSLMTVIRRGCCNFLCCPHSHTSSVHLRTYSLSVHPWGWAVFLGVGGRLLWRAPQTSWKWLNQSSSFSNNQCPHCRWYAATAIDNDRTDHG